MFRAYCLIPLIAEAPDGNDKDSLFISLRLALYEKKSLCVCVGFLFVTCLLKPSMITSFQHTLETLLLSLVCLVFVHWMVLSHSVRHIVSVLSQF